MGQRNVVIVGAGSSGLLVSVLLARAWPDKNIILIEQPTRIGGLLKSFDYGKHGCFDYEAHNFQETLTEGLDQLFLRLIPKKQWHVLAGSQREIAGHFSQGKLHHNTPFLDLRSLPDNDYQTCIKDFFLNLCKNQRQVSDFFENAYDYCNFNYGKLITEKIIQPILNNFFGKDLNTLHRLPLDFLHLNRIAFLDEELVEDLTKSDILRKRIAFNGQRDLPLERSTEKRNFYPAKMGIQQVSDGFQSLLDKLNIKVLTESSVTNISLENGKAASLRVKDAKGIEIDLPTEHLVWTSGIHPLAIILGLTQDGETFDKPAQTVFAHLKLDKKLKASDLHYIYPFDLYFYTYRVVNYANYCPNTNKGPNHPIALEIFLPEHKHYEPEAMKIKALNELKIINLISEGTRVIFSRFEKTTEGFPMPTLYNFKLGQMRRERIKAKQLKNLTLLGILSEDNLFFHKDVIVHAFKTVKFLITSSLKKPVQELGSCHPVHR